MEPGTTHWRWKVPGARRAASRVELVRRGVRHGSLQPLGRPPATPEHLDQRFAAAQPILLRGWLAVESTQAKARIEASRRWFDRLRAQESFAAGVRARLARRRGEGAQPRISGSSVDLADPREIEKVHVDLQGLGRAGKELYAKLSWIAADQRDDSLRVRFSFGQERSGAWMRDARRSLAADRLAELVFPECTLISGHRALHALLERLHAAPVRLSERIVYNNAPGGGASFHHDAEPRQLGVVYGQLSGSTGWLALPRRELAAEVAALATRGVLAKRAGSVAKALRALEHCDWPPLDRLLNQDPRLTRRLVERGAFYRLEPGDVLILPSPSAADCAWHSVFALGTRPSLAHSYGLFAQRHGAAKANDD